jgi:hypothetical protein
MIYFASGEWMADLKAMTCRNMTWNITVSFEKQGEAFIGTISDMPDNLSRRWMSAKSGNLVREKLIKEAQEVFLMAYNANELEECSLSRHNLKDRKRLILKHAEMEKSQAV